MSLRDQLIEFLEEQGIELARDVPDETPLFAEGRLDSLALFNLVLWVEERTGEPLDPTRVDLVREWASVRDLLDFVRARGGRDG